MPKKNNLTEAFKWAASSFGQKKFTTKEFVERYRAQCPEEWNGLIKAYGTGGKGSGHPYSANTRVSSKLGVLSRAGDLLQLPYVKAPTEWGNAIIRQWVVSKNGTLPAQISDVETGLPSWTDREYREGSPQLRTHLRQERDSRLPKDKKDQFRTIHGRLFCERCSLVPTETYGVEFGDSIIEVHHAKILVRDMVTSQNTDLVDLQCLCANCHRVVHAKLRFQERFIKNKQPSN